MDSDNNQIDDSFDCDLLDESIEEDAAALQEKLNAQNGGGISDIPTSTPLNNGSAGGDHAQGDLSSSKLASSNRMQELAEETRKIREITTGGGSMIIDSPNLSISSGSQHNVQSAVHLSIEEKAELDARSVYVGNVEYAATPIQLEEHFRGCGPIERVTILADKYSGHPKGFAYIQFTEVEGMNNALALDESLFLGRQIKVNAKRTNKPGMSSTHRPPRGGRGGLRGRGAFGGGRFGFRGRGRGGPMRGSRRFTPY